jgi:hypothetical protein
MTLRRSIPWVILAVGLFAALDIVFSTSVSAAGVISANCTGLNCQLCNLFALADTLIKYAIYVAVPIGGAVFAYAGFLFITSGGSTENASKARTLFFDVILGFIFVLIAFLVVDTIIQTLANGTFTGANWRGVSCTSDRYLGGGFASAPINPITPVTVTPTPGGSTSGITVQGSTMTAAQAQQALTSRGIAVAASVNLEGINSDVIDKIIATSIDMGRPLTITSARDGVHANTCHAAQYPCCSDALIKLWTPDAELPHDVHTTSRHVPAAWQVFAWTPSRAEVIVSGRPISLLVAIILSITSELIPSRLTLAATAMPRLVSACCACAAVIVDPWTVIPLVLPPGVGVTVTGVIGLMGAEAKPPPK